jgi:hypothetical protein
MRSDRCLVNTRLAVLGVVVMFSCVCTWAAAPARDAGSNSQSASWAAKDLDFAYRGFTTKYSCDGLQQKMRRVLTRLGARADMQLRAYGCTRLIAPDPFAGVRMQIHVLQPSDPHEGQSVPAHWQRVDLLANRDPVDAAADCELIEQIKQKILPLFATRNVDAVSDCANRQLLLGGTRLRAEVLVADPVTARTIR